MNHKYQPDETRLSKKQQRIPAIAPDSLLHPFHSLENPRAYFHWDRITSSLITKERTLSQALSCLESEEKMAFSVRAEYDQAKPEEGPDLAAEGTFLSSDTHVTFRSSRDELLSLHCSDPACKGKGNFLCLHETMLLLKIQDYLEKENLGEPTSLQADRVLGRMLPSMEDWMPLVALKPTLVLSGHTLALQLKIGVKKKPYEEPEHLYKVYQLSELYRAVCEKGLYAPARQQLRIDFAACRLDETSQALFALIRQEWMTASRYTVSEQPDWEARLPLYSYSLDRFFDLMKDSSVPFLNENNTLSPKRIRLSLERPNVTLTLSPLFAAASDAMEDPSREEDRLEGVQLSGELPYFFSGGDAGYLLSDGMLIRLEKPDADIYARLYDGETHLNLSFGLSKLNEVMNDLLPRLSKVFTIEVEKPELLRKLTPPIPKFTFTLDVVPAPRKNLSDSEADLSASVDSDEVAVCHGVVRYVGRALPLSVTECGSDGSISASMPIPDQEATDNRNLFREKQILLLIQSFFPKAGSTPGTYTAAIENSRDPEWREAVLSALGSVGEVIETEAFRRLNTVTKTRIGYDVSLRDNQIRVDVSSGPSSARTSLTVLQNCFQLSRIQSPANSFSLPRFHAWFLDHLMKGFADVDYRPDPAFSAFTASLEGSSDYNRISEHASRLNPFLFSADVSSAIAWLWFRHDLGFGSLLAVPIEEVTSQEALIAAFLSDFRNHPSSGSCLLLCPRSSLAQWAQVLISALGSDLHLSASSSRADGTASVPLIPGRTVYLADYDDFQREYPAYQTVGWDTVILEDLRPSDLSFALSRKIEALSASFRLGITHQVNRDGKELALSETGLWPLWKRLMPDVFTNQRVYKKYAPAMTRVHWLGMSETQETRAGIAALPDGVDSSEPILRSILQGGKEHALYLSKKATLIRQIQAGNGPIQPIEQLRIFSTLLQLRLLGCDTSLLKRGPTYPSLKRAAVLNFIRNAPRRRILIYSEYPTFLVNIQDDLSLWNIPVQRHSLELDEPFYSPSGDVLRMGKRTRYALLVLGSGLEKTDQQSPDGTNADRTPSDESSSTEDMASGNQRADLILLCDPCPRSRISALMDFSKDPDAAAIPVFQLVAKDTLEEVLIPLLQKEDPLAERLLANDAAVLAKVSREELLGLFD